MTHPGEFANARPPKRRVDVLAVLFLVVPALFFVVGLTQAAVSIFLHVRGETVTGTVLADTDKKGATADVNFVTHDGQSVTTWVSVGDMVVKGEQIELVYDPKKPTRLKAADQLLEADLMAAFICIFPIFFSITAMHQLRLRQR